MQSGSDGPSVKRLTCANRFRGLASIASNYSLRRGLEAVLALLDGLRRGIANKVHRRSEQRVHVVFGVPEHDVTTPAQNAAHLAKLMTMINDKLTTRMIWLGASANCALAALQIKHLIPLIERDSIVETQ